MAEKSKRLKKNISFSPHEKDIYDYLDSVENASALIKRLVYNHMIMEKGLVAPNVVKVEVKNDDTKQETQEEQDVANNDETSVTIEETDETEEIVDETAEEPKVETAFTKEALETIELLPDL